MRKNYLQHPPITRVYRRHWWCGKEGVHVREVFQQNRRAPRFRDCLTAAAVDVNIIFETTDAACNENEDWWEKTAGKSVNWWWLEFDLLWFDGFKVIMSLGCYCDFYKCNWIFFFNSCRELCSINRYLYGHQSILRLAAEQLSIIVYIKTIIYLKHNCFIYAYCVYLYIVIHEIDSFRRSNILLLAHMGLCTV